MSRLLVISDLDGTLIGDPAALAAFRDWFAERQDQLQIAYSSGRSHASMTESVREHQLPTPVALISEVGTSIRRFPSGERLPDWPASPFWSASVVQEVLSPLSHLELQPEEFQTQHKVSYFLHDASVVDFGRIRQSLFKRSIEAEIVYSSNRDLDILPSGVNKGAAAMRLIQSLACSLDGVIACGDSGNDSSMLLIGCRGVIVSNAQRELKTLKGDRIYHSKAAFAYGVIEGLNYWLDRP